MKKHRPMLLGSPKVTIRTDHQPLKWMLTDKEARGWVARWQMKLQEFNYEVIYREGSKHVNADAMTQPPIARAPEELEEKEQLPAMIGDEIKEAAAIQK